MCRAIGGAILTLSVAFGLFIATGSTAQAQSPYYGQDGQYRRDRDGQWRRNRERNRRHRRERRNDRYERDDDYGYERNRGYGNDGGYYGGYNNTNQVELERGYQQGLETGASDGQRGQSYSPERSRHYKNASSQAFLDGFVRGYDEGYRQYANNNGGYRRGNSRYGIGDILGGILGRP